jgi:hypothetical protein
MAKPITFEGVSWNVDSIINDKLTEQQFIQQGLKEGQYCGFTNAEQSLLLKEAYRLIKAAVSG